MAIKRALPLIILIAYGFAQSNTSKSYIGLQAEATVEIQYDGQIGSGIILMTGNPASVETYSYSVTTTSTLPTTTSSKTTLPLATAFNTPLSFGASRTQIVNATIGFSQMVTGVTATQILPEHSTSSPSQSSIVAGSGASPCISWSHMVFWAVATELIIGCL